MQFFGHHMRRDWMEKLLVEGVIEGTRGRPCEKYLDGLASLRRGRMTPTTVIR